VALTAWSLFAFGGVYTWTAIPIVAGTLVLASQTRPRLFEAGFGWLDAALCVVLLIAALQLIPVAPALRHAISPGMTGAEQKLHLNAAEWSAAAHPLSLDSALTMWAGTLAGTFILFFWSARTAFSAGGMRRTCRAIAICGLIAAVLSVLQHATSPRLFYWLWAPIASNAAPYTPFGNRNHLASWLVMAIPLTLGYVMMRLESVRARTITADMFDDTSVWLLGSVCAMAAALLASLSRSGIIAGAAGVMAFVTLSRNRLPGKGRAGLLVGLAAVAVVAAMYTNLDALLSRLNDAVNVPGVGGRREIWSVTLTIVRDFRVAGVGIGAFERAMSLYQPPHVFSFNTAHNEYLQILTEGGIVLATAVAAAILAGMARIRRALADDRSPLFWARAGATSGAFAVAVQSVWETGLRIPANAVLFAVCCAVAMATAPGRDAASGQ
jgi:O-antigen ligase